MPPRKKPIGNNLQFIRTLSGITQEQLAVRSGVSVHAIRAIEQGVNTNPKMDTCVALAKALDVTVGQLLGTERLMD